MINTTVFIVLFSIAALLSAGAGDKAGTLIVNMHSFKENAGSARLVLYDESGKDAYPMEPEKGCDSADVEIKNKSAKAVFTNIKPGRYAVSVHHDQDGDGAMDTNFLGIPSEGYGASNDAKGFMGPPSFEDASFILNSDTLEISITIKY